VFSFYIIDSSGFKIHCQPLFRKKPQKKTAKLQEILQENLNKIIFEKHIDISQNYLYNEKN
jgi:hypothetical protein